MNKRIAIIGGGAAGMMAAATLAEQPRTPAGQIDLYEKNGRLGAKVIISGGGRCNVTTGFFKLDQLLPNYTRGAAFLRPALEQFGPRKVMQRFEQHGVKMKTEADGRVFPVSDDGHEVVGAFETIFRTQQTNILLKTWVTDIQRRWERFEVVSPRGTIIYDVVVLTTGGEAYAHTGSTGDGYTFARSCGHTITPLGPSLNSFLTQVEWLHELSGTSFPSSTLRGLDEQGQPITVSWPMLCTHFGISWPAVFAFSSHIPFVLIDHNHPYELRRQPDSQTMTHRRYELLTEAAVQDGKKQLNTQLHQFFTKRFCQLFLQEVAQIAETTPINQLSKQQRHTISGLLGDGIPVQLLARRPGDEFVTAWGVNTDELDPLTMESRLCSGLYFAGEIVNVDGVTGGYNLQASRAMGRLVGKTIR